MYQNGLKIIVLWIHQVDDKIHGRFSGHYALVTQQPLKGRVKQGGQLVGKMEVWALEGFGVAHILQEMLTYKSDHILKCVKKYSELRLLEEQYLNLWILPNSKEGSLIGLNQKFYSMIDQYKDQHLRVGSISPE
ncbi:DNA-directed RNA polymerase subunit beta [Medicago truncatula]|uniref:DNA-directed RNA polymerase n=1 Tax=Medicago truncatula TaxID=3880 RepID=G7KNS0_MEDTR|nr:DNA-directed RNA polymerase subunit beta [Medicago truncatula]